MRSIVLWGAMSEIPYFFETPVPRYFRDTGWFENENTFKFVTWAFSKCQTRPHKVAIEGKEITLKPYEFIAGRLSSPKECFLTENQFRNQQKTMVEAGLLKKTTNSLTNHFSCYIWLTDRFSQTDNQPNNQPATNRPPTGHHKDRTKNIDIRTTTTTSPSSMVVAVVPQNENQIKEASKSCKAWLDNQALTIRKRKVGRDYEEITWGKDWILPIEIFEKLISQYGYEYFIKHLNYMASFQNDFDKGKGEKGISKPEAFLRKSCQENWALTKK